MAEQSVHPAEGALRIAVVGCCHGELDVIYSTIETACEADGGKRPDLVVICGDFQAVRNEQGLECMACPLRFRAMGDFWQYYAGKRAAPVPTLIIGGNHEASAHFQSLPYGGMIAPNMFFMGYAGVVNFGGLRIAGISGIFDKRDFRQPHFEQAPYDERSMRTVYHTRERDVWRLAQLASPVDIVLSHDWPAGVDMAGDQQWLLRKKRFFAEDSAKGELGSPANWNLMTLLRPAFWFAAHLHVKFPAIVSHSPPQPLHPKMNRGWFAVAYTDLQSRPSAAPVAAVPAAEPADAAAAAFAAPPTNARTPFLREDGYACTRFLALDKPLPGRGFVQILDVDPAAIKAKRMGAAAAAENETPAASGAAATPAGGAAGEHTLCFDSEWAAVVQATHATAMDPQASGPLPFLAPLPAGAVAKARTALAAAFGGGEGGVPVPPSVRSTAPAFSPPEGFASSYDAKAAALGRVRRGAAEPGDEHATEWGYPGTRRAPPAAEGNAFTDEYLATLGLQHSGTVPAGWKPAVQPQVPEAQTAQAQAAPPAAASAPSYSPDGTVTPAVPAAIALQTHEQSVQPVPTDAAAVWKDEAEIDIDDL